MKKDPFESSVVDDLKSGLMWGIFFFIIGKILRALISLIRHSIILTIKMLYWFAGVVYHKLTGNRLPGIFLPEVTLSEKYQLTTTEFHEMADGPTRCMTDEYGDGVIHYYYAPLQKYVSEEEWRKLRISARRERSWNGI